jgi:glycosyltransferase involved in cell wall biosynthesis
MAQAILAALADDDQRRRMGEAGLARLQTRFTVERMVAGSVAEGAVSRAPVPVLVVR